MSARAALSVFARAHHLGRHSAEYRDWSRAACRWTTISRAPARPAPPSGCGRRGRRWRCPPPRHIDQPSGNDDKDHREQRRRHQAGPRRVRKFGGGAMAFDQGAGRRRNTGAGRLSSRRWARASAVSDLREIVASRFRLVGAPPRPTERGRTGGAPGPARSQQPSWSPAVARDASNACISGIPSDGAGRAHLCRRRPPETVSARRHQAEKAAVEIGQKLAD